MMEEYISFKVKNKLGGDSRGTQGDIKLAFVDANRLLCIESASNCLNQPTGATQVSRKEEFNALDDIYSDWTCLKCVCVKKTTTIIIPASVDAIKYKPAPTVKTSTCIYGHMQLQRVSGQSEAGRPGDELLTEIKNRPRGSSAIRSIRP